MKIVTDTNIALDTILTPVDHRIVSDYMCLQFPEAAVQIACRRCCVYYKNVQMLCGGGTAAKNA